MSDANQELPVLSSEERLQAYQLIVNGCTHSWSKNKLVETRAKANLNALVPLTEADPYFLAHFTSYALKKSKSKDLRVFLTYVAGLSSADGTPFSPGSKYFKPNLRYVSDAALHLLPPKLALRVLELANYKYSVSGQFNESRHFPTHLRTAFEKYLAYREKNLEILEGIRKAGLKNTIIHMARILHYDLNDDAREVLGWPRKGQKFTPRPPAFEGLDDLEIAETIRENKIPYIGVLGELARANQKITPAVAVAMLEQASGDQAVIMRKTFEDAGVLDDKEVLKLFESKISEAKTALDRAETMSKSAGEAVAQVMKQAKSKARKSELGDIGRVYVHLDLSPSMEPAIDVAKERGAIIAEMVSNPATNFAWGAFNDRAEELPIPQAFEKDAFAQILFGKVCNGMTDAFSLYPHARKHEADVDVFISDGCHNFGGDLERRIREYHIQNPEAKKPKAMVWVNVYNSRGMGYIPSGADAIKRAYEANNIPVAVMDPGALTDSALVVEAVKTAMLGPIATIDEIMSTPLLELPDYYYAV